MNNEQQQISIRIPVFGLILILILFSLACSSPESWHQTTLVYFDTICEIRLYCSSSLYKDTLEEIHNVFTSIEENFGPDSYQLSSPQVIKLYRKAYQIYLQSEGAFDISVAPLSRLWGFLNGQPHLPPPEEIKKTLSLVGMNKIKIENNHLILRPGQKLDWGGIAKGYGVDLAVKRAQALGVLHGFINAGGDLYCWGQNPEKSLWKVGIKHPRENGFLGVLAITNLAATTTGDYQRYFLYQGQRYHHVFDPRTGYPARGKTSVTVIGPETAICDALSTALFVFSQPEKLISAFPEYGAIIYDEQGHLSQIGQKFNFQPLSVQKLSF